MDTWLRSICDSLLYWLHYGLMNIGRSREVPPIFLWWFGHWDISIFGRLGLCVHLLHLGTPLRSLESGAIKCHAQFGGCHLAVNTRWQGNLTAADSHVVPTRLPLLGLPPTRRCAGGDVFIGQQVGCLLLDLSPCYTNPPWFVPNKAVAIFFHGLLCLLPHALSSIGLGPTMKLHMFNGNYRVNKGESF